MRSRLASRLAHGVVALITIAAWFIASDHCALAGILLRPAAVPSAQESCPGHSSQPEKKPGQSELPCCKTLVAAMAPAKVATSYDSTLFVVRAYPAADFQLALGHFAAPSTELDTGPPQIRSFAESVLQRSLLAHAPPLLG